MKPLQDKLNEMPESRQDTIARSAAQLRDVDAWIEHAERLEDFIEVLLEHFEDGPSSVRSMARLKARLRARDMTLLMNRPGRLGQAMIRRSY